MEKQCIICDGVFIKPKKYSREQWLNRKVCSDKPCISRHSSIRTKKLLNEKPEFLLMLRTMAVGRKQSKETKEKRGIYRTGDQHPKWKGGISDDGMGYLRLNKGKKRIHRIVVEKSLGRVLSSNEIVHHIDGDKTNNNISNLQIVTRSEHCQIHKPRLGTSK